MSKKILLISPFLNLISSDFGGKDDVVLKVIDFYLTKSYEVHIFPIKEDLRESIKWKFKENYIHIHASKGFKFSLKTLLNFMANFKFSRTYINSFLSGEFGNFDNLLKEDFAAIHSLYTRSNYNDFLIEVVPKDTKKISHYHHGKSSNYNMNDLNIFVSKFEEMKYKDSCNTSVIYNPVENISSSKIIDHNEDYFIFLGRIDKRKRLDLLLEAINEIKEDFKYKLIVIGTEQNKDYSNYCRNYVINKSLNVDFLGLVSEEYKYSLITSNFCRGMFMPSSEESFGIAYVECFLKGKKCIGYYEAIKEFNNIFDYELGIPFKGTEKNPKKLAKCIRDFEENYTELIPSEVITKIEKMFSLTSFQDSLNKEINKLI